MDVETTNKRCKTKSICIYCNKLFSTKKSLKIHIESACRNSPITITLARCPSCGLTCTPRYYSNHFSRCTKVWGHCRGFPTNDSESPSSDKRNTHTKEDESKKATITTSQNLSNSSQSTKPSEPQKKSLFIIKQRRSINQWYFVEKSISHNNQHHSEDPIYVDDSDSSDSSSNNLKNDINTKEKAAPVLPRFQNKVVNTDDKPSMTEKGKPQKPQVKSKRTGTTPPPSPKLNQTKPKLEGREIRLQGYQVLDILTIQLASLQHHAVMVFT